jgi:hypothetical protein
MVTSTCDSDNCETKDDSKSTPAAARRRLTPYTHSHAKKILLEAA